MRLLSLFMIVGYFEIYEVLMFYHGEKLWLYSGLTEILMLALLIVINNEGCFWRNYCILILEQGMTSLLFSIFVYLVCVSGIPLEADRSVAEKYNCRVRGTGTGYRVGCIFDYGL